ncbi:MAG: gas vesicle protein K, partial [Desulfobacterales bacterium CG23_combo_of_CG06-09_8_20_14_all_52_9]
MTPRGNRASSRRLNLDPEKVKNGLAELVLTVVKLLHELVEKQAIRRIDGGGLTDEEIERLGYTLMRQSEEIAR